MKLTANEPAVDLPSSSRSPTQGLLVLAAAFLFHLQLLLTTERVLPWFSGAASVWQLILGTGMVTGIVGLLAGYALASRPGPIARIIAWLLLVLLLAMLPALPGVNWLQPVMDNPVAHLLKLLGSNSVAGLLAFSFFIGAQIARPVANSSPGETLHSAVIGAILALLGYVFLIDPMLSIAGAGLGFMVASLLFAVAAGIWLWKQFPAAGRKQSSRPPHTSWVQHLLRVGLAAFATAVLFGVSLRLQRDAVSIPLYWAVPLAAFLAAALMGMSRSQFQSRGRTIPFFVVAAALVVAGMNFGPAWSHPLQTVVLIVMVLAGTLAAAAEMVRESSDWNPSVMFTGVLGICLGTVSMTLAAPYWLTDYREYPISLLGLAGLLWLSAVTGPGPMKRRLIVAIPGGVLLLLFAMGLNQVWQVRSIDLVARIRTFQGTTTIRRTGKAPTNAVMMYHGSQPRAGQYLAPDLSLAPAFWQGPATGIGRMFGALPKGNFRNIGVVGMGNAGLLAYTDPSDSVTFFEADPGTYLAAERYFAYLARAALTPTFELGDARWVLADKDPQKFDVLVLDSFNQESLPVHLLTEEAFKVWQHHLAPDGIIAVNLTNQEFDLATVVWRQALKLEMQTILLINEADPSGLSSAAEWMLLTRNKEFLNKGRFQMPSPEMIEIVQQFPLWTDSNAAPLAVRK